MTVEVTGDSEEAVALKLLEAIRMIEFPDAGDRPGDRNWYLDTYAECLAVVKGKQRQPVGSDDKRGASASASF